jgi:hypothetical protein
MFGCIDTICAAHVPFVKGKRTVCPLDTEVHQQSRDHVIALSAGRCPLFWGLRRMWGNDGHE